jgi:hemolysin activation/secretion protein
MLFQNSVSSALRLIALGLLMTTLPLPALAQTVPIPGVTQPPVPPQPQPEPNRDRFPQTTPPLEPIPKAPSAQPPAPAAPANSGAVTIRRVETTGSTILSPEQITAITRPAEGRTLNREEIFSTVVIPLIKLYYDQGYLTSRAEIQNIEDGVVSIRFIEGSVARVEIEGTKRLDPEYVRSRINLAISKPLSTPRLEDQLRLLRADPQFANVEATLRRSEDASQSVLLVRVAEAKPIAIAIGFDNYSSASSGAERGLASVLYRNPLGIGDEVSFGYSVSTGASNVYDFNYRAPLNPMDGSLGLRVLISDSKITDPRFVAAGIRGTSELYEVSYRQPLIRTLREEFALSLGLTYQSGQTFIFDTQPSPFGVGPDANGVSKVSVLKFTQDYTNRDENGAWSMRSQFNFGLNMLGATFNVRPAPDGRFVNWSSQFSRLQSIGSGNFLIFQGDLQLSLDPLLPSQQFILGGIGSVRGFRQGIRQGDNGFRLSTEGRFPIAVNEAGLPTLQLAPFIEGGGVWNVNGNLNPLPEKTFLVTTGLGVIWGPLPGLNLRVDYGVPIIYLPDRGTNLQDNGFNFSINYQPQ